MAKFCPKCGTQMDDNQASCPSCGTTMAEYNNQNLNTQTINQQNNSQQYNYQQNNPQQYSDKKPKSKIAAGLLAIFLGSLGIHNFYLGYKRNAIIQLCLTLIGWILCGLGPLVAGIWAFVEGIMILTGSINKDADGIPLE